MSYELMDSNFLAAAASSDDLCTSKRREPRQRVLLRAQLHAVDRHSDVRVTDLSRSGLRGATDIPLAVGQLVFVSLDELTHCSGTIRWTQDHRFGLKFSRMLDVIPDIQNVDVGILPGQQDRMPRISTNLRAKISICSWSCGAKIRNVSKSGMMVETQYPLTAKQPLLVSLSNGKMLTADVRWVEGERVGIELCSPLSILQFTHGDLH